MKKKREEKQEVILCGNRQCSACGKCNLHFWECPLFKSETKRATLLNRTESTVEPKQKRVRQLNHNKANEAYKGNTSGITEDSEQIAVIEYCKLHGIVVVHVANESKRSVVYGAKLKKMGLRKGFPDMFIPTAKKGYHGLMVELKRDEKSKPTAEQLQWVEYLNKQGYYACVCYGAGQAIEKIKNYFKEQ